MVRPENEDSEVHETSPLLAPSENNVAVERTSGLPILHNALRKAYICAFAVSLSFAITQVPLLYVFRVMACDAYYEKHSLPNPELHDRCDVREIEARTATAVALLAGSTTIFGLLNLLVTGWCIKRFGVKIALLISVFWSAARLLIQNIGVMTGSNLGILIVQSSQIVTIAGGPYGYVLALNSFVTDIVPHEDRTSAIGRLQGYMQIGSAVGMLIGGVTGEAFGLVFPFRITLLLFLLCSWYVALCLPTIPPEKDTVARETNTGISRFLGPLHIFTPQKWILPSGHTSTQFGALTLGIGVFLAILATGYIPTLLQMYSTNEFHFSTMENGWLIFMYSSLRGLYLTFIFPCIISAGRKWMRSRTKDSETGSIDPEADPLLTHVPIAPNEIASIDPAETETEPLNQPPPEEEENFAFDLFYARASLIVDGVLTAGAMFVSQGWQMFLVAAILPLAAGTGSASKGTLLQMVPSHERVDALAAITLVENFARLSTTALLGMIFAVLAGVGKAWAVFGCNAGIAVLGFIILCLSRFPPMGSRRVDG
ncbi:MFS general substrate transporter [Sporormia fimetaria CBS 119925]|uniref:MFS general substrate transporter n=1 Tax=Sporormia fimetaria CBS 119925 TaxID=1340428 RepID=A0A6A6VHR3_9PLEO|nr:MFS general substrate transporter [Sporormia fimetaria CBS 119925]